MGRVSLLPKDDTGSSKSGNGTQTDSDTVNCNIDGIVNIGNSCKNGYRYTNIRVDSSIIEYLVEDVISYNRSSNTSDNFFHNVSAVGLNSAKLIFDSDIITGSGNIDTNTNTDINTGTDTDTNTNTNINTGTNTDTNTNTNINTGTDTDTDTDTDTNTNTNTNTDTDTDTDTNNTNTNTSTYTHIDINRIRSANDRVTFSSSTTLRRSQRIALRSVNC